MPSSSPTPPSEEPLFIEEPVESPEMSTPKKKKKEAPNKRKKETASALKNIYENDGELPDFTKMDRKRRSPRAILLGMAAFFAVLAIAAWAGFFIFKPYHRTGGDGLKLSVLGSQTVRAGEEQRYEFTYKNTENVPLAALELRVVIPKEFSVTSITPLPTNEPATWLLGSLDSGKTGSIAVEGFFNGPAEGKTAFQSIATYRPANFNSDFQAITTFDVALNGTTLEGAITGPPEAAPGETVSYEYTLRNASSIALENIEVQLSAPDTFLANAAEPKMTHEGDRRWNIPKIESGDETKIKIDGSFTSSARDRTEIGFRVGIRQGDTFLLHRTDTASTDVLAGDLTLTMVLNGSTKDTSASFGDSLRISLAYRNAGTRTLENVNVALSVAEDPGGLIDWQKIAMTPVGRSSAGTISWGPKELKALEAIAPQAEGTVDVTIPVISRPPAKEGADEIRFGGSALISTIEQRVVARQVQTTPIIVRIHSDAALTAEARYFDEDSAPLGSGPLPPEVGETTKIRVVWTVANSRHDLEQVRVSTVLPSKVSWSDKAVTGQGALVWDEATRTVRWTIDRLPKTETSVEASFEVSITPEQAEIGKFVTLTRDNIFEARDTKTGITISKTLPALTTEMPTDEGAKGKGIVVE